MPKLNSPNLAEGVVIKPIKNITVTTMYGRSVRAIVKKKIELFSETVDLQENKQQAVFGAEKLKNELFGMVTLNRLKNVLSKFGRANGTKMQRAKLQELMLQDIMEAFKTSHPGTVDTSMLMTELNKRIKALIDSHFDDKK